MRSFDQAGNVSEWTETSSSTYRRIMGSWYYTEVGALEPNFRSPEYEDQRVGVRIASASAVQVPAMGLIGTVVLSVAMCLVAFWVVCQNTDLRKRSNRPAGRS